MGVESGSRPALLEKEKLKLRTCVFVQVSILSLLVGLAFGVLAMRNHLLQMGAGNRSTGQQSDDEDGGKGSDSTGAESGSETDERSKSTRSRKR